MVTKSFDRVLITLGLISILASFLFFSTAKRPGQDFRDTVAQIKFLKNTVQTKMAGSVSWFAGEEEEKISAYGLGVTASSSAARYLYMDKIQIISLDDSLIEFLPEDEVKLSQGKFIALNPDGKTKILDQNGKPMVIKPGTLYSATSSRIQTEAVAWNKVWSPQGSPYSVKHDQGKLTETFLLSPPPVHIIRAEKSCMAQIEAIPGDEGDLKYEALINGEKTEINNFQFTLPSSNSVIEVRTVSSDEKSPWRKLHLPAHCVTDSDNEIVSASPIVPPEDLSFFNKAYETIIIDNESTTHSVIAYFTVNEKSPFEVQGPNLDRQGNIQGKFKKEYKLHPGITNFRITHEGQLLERSFEVKVRPPFKLKDSIFSEE